MTQGVNGRHGGDTLINSLLDCEPSIKEKPHIRRVDVLGVRVSTVTPESAIHEMARWIQNGQRHYVCVTSVHGLMEAQRDPALKCIHNDSGLTVPDGMPLVWACHQAGASWVSRVYGPDLLRSMSRIGAEQGWRMFFYGASPQVVRRLEHKLHALNPDLQVVGTLSPPYRPLRPDERKEIVALINAANPDIVWVGLSTPKQERWMAENRTSLTAPLLVGVGAAFDLVAETIRQAPPWMQSSGLEWAYRLWQEPRRLGWRYARNNPAFLLSIARRRPSLAP